MLRQSAPTLVAALLLAACGQDAVRPDVSSTGDRIANPPAAPDFNVCAGAPTAKGASPGWPYIYGTAGDDKLVADEDYAVLIYGRAGNDCLIGGEPNNSLFGEQGDDVLLGGGGRDYLSGGPGRDLMRSGDGDDYINASDGEADVVHAGRGDDTIIAEDGAIDEIDCGEGTDVAFVDPNDIVRGCEIVNPPVPW